MFSFFVSVPAILVLVAMGFVNALFYHLLKAPTLSGRKIMDQIEGFKLYLSVAEKERLNLLNPPEKTPALFEKYLPYALALNVENAWSEQFAEVLAQAGTETQPYSPRLVFRQFLGQLPHLQLHRQPGQLLCRGHLVLIHRAGLVLGERRRRVLRRRGGRRRRQRLVGGGPKRADTQVRPYGNFFKQQRLMRRVGVPTRHFFLITRPWQLFKPVPHEPSAHP